MGKIRKNKKPKAQQSKSVETDTTSTPFTETQSLAQLLPKDFDLASVKSFKSIKNKFGIKKQITKTEKLKIRKEILKQKIDFIKETVDSNKPTKLKKKKSDKKLKGILKVPNKIIVKDQDEEYMKLGNKKKGIPKAKKRQQQLINNVNALKSLMFKK